MTRYAAFAFAKYYPYGGWDDLVGIYDDPADTAAPLRNWYANEKGVTGAYWQIVDLQTRQVIEEGEFNDRGNPVTGEAP